MSTTTYERTNALSSKQFHSNERREIGKTEVIDGKLVPRPAASRWHNLIVTNFVISLGSRIQRAKCELYAGEMQVQFGSNSICYPDIVIVSGEPQFADDRAETLLNPSIVAEVFSANAKTTDRTRRLEGFLANPAIKECLLVNENEMRVEHYARQSPKQWIYRIYNERDDVISLESIQCKLSVADVYAQVKLKDSELSLKAVS